MACSGDSYRHYIPDLGLSIEKNTANVPQDGKYYLVRNGQILKGFGTLRKAEMAFKKLLAESGYMLKPVEQRRKSAAEQDIDR